MPYKLRGKCVVRSDTGAVVKCHPDDEAARKHLAALKINVQESGPLRGLLEGFAADSGPVVLDGRMRPGDRVRVDVKGAESIVGRMVRPSDAKPASHVLVAPEGGGPHVEAAVKSVRHDTPEQQAAERARRQAEQETERQIQAPPPGERPAPPGAPPAVQTERGLRSMAKGSARLQPEAQRQRERRGGVVEALLEGFNPAERRGEHGRWVRSFFDLSGGKQHMMVPIERLTPSKPRQEASIAEAKRRMEEARAGRMARRGPISVKARPDGGLDITDGNATYGALKDMGAREIPVRISALDPATRPEDIRAQNADTRAQIEREKAARVTPGERSMLVRDAAAARARGPQPETTAQQIERKSPGAHAELAAYQSVLSGARAAAARPNAAPVVPGETVGRSVYGNPVTRADVTDRFGGYQVGDQVDRYQQGVKQGPGEVVGYGRNGNLVVREPKYGTTVHAHHSELKRRKVRNGIVVSEAFDAGELRDRHGRWMLRVGEIKGLEKVGKKSNALAAERHAQPSVKLSKKQRKALLKGINWHSETTPLLAQLLAGLREAFAMAAASGSSSAGGGSPRPRVRAQLPSGGGSSSAYTPSETPAQSRARAKTEIAQAKQGITDFNAKHPRAGHGRFTTKGGTASKAKPSSRSSTRASKATPGGARILSVGSKGTLVRSIQRQLHLPATGTFDARTQAAIERYQRQHHLLVDGKVGRQTIASLRGNPNARTIKPGPIPASTARVHNPRAKAKPKAKAPPAPVRIGGGTVV